MKKLFFVTVLLFANVIIFGQLPKKWKDISKDEFAIGNNGDTSVHAVILQESAKYYFDVWREDYRLFCEITRRIKIIDEQGVKYTNIRIPYYSINDFEDFASFQGAVYYLDNGKIKSNKLKNKTINDKKINDYVSVRTAEFPEAAPGTIVEYRYTIATLDIVKPRPWQFQHEIPCLYSSIELSLPEFINYQLRIVGEKSLSEAKNEYRSKHLKYMFRYEDPIPTGQGHQDQSFSGTADFDFQEQIFKYTMKDLPAYKDEELTDCKCNYQKGLYLDLYRIDQKTGLISDYDRFAWALLTLRLYNAVVNNTEVMSRLNSDYLQAPSSFVIYQLGDWTSMDKNLQKNPHFGLVLMKAWDFQTQLNYALNGAGTEEIQKMIAIYNYVRDNIKWNERYSIYTSDDLDKIVRQKQGNSADINFLLMYLLQKVGIKVSPVLIKTVNQGHIDEQMAATSQFNHVIASAEVNGKRYLLDAINPDMPWYLLDKQDLNLEGRIIKDISSDFIPIVPNKTTYTQVATTISLNQSTAKCSISEKDFGYFAEDKRQAPHKFVNEFKNKFQNISNFDYSYKFLHDKNEALELTMSFDIQDIIEGNQIYPFDLFTINDFYTKPQRLIPVYFGFGFNKMYMITVQIPENKQVTSYPENFYQKIKGAEIMGQSVVNDETVMLMLKINITKNFFTTDEYPQLRELFLQMDKYINTPIIFENK